MKPILIIGGPTASGKSALALRIAEAHDAVIINGDSQQIYSEIPIITAQPSADEQKTTAHRLYGHVSLTEEYSLGRWLDEVTLEINAAHKANKLPIIVGGTGMYLRALVDGIAEIPEIDPRIREAARALHGQIGNLIFYQLLKKHDPISAERIGSGDSQRMIRAFEVFEQTGKSISYFQDQPAKRYTAKGQCLCFRVLPEREILYANCDARFDQMIERGAVAEIAALQNIAPNAPGMKALGLPELVAHRDGKSSLEEASESAKMNTRRYAKRQTTWFRNQCQSWPKIDDPKSPHASSIILQTLAQ